VSRRSTISTTSRIRWFGATLALVGLAGAPLAARKLSEIQPPQLTRSANYSMRLSSMRSARPPLPSRPPMGAPLPTLISTPAPTTNPGTDGPTSSSGIFLQLSSLSPTYSVADVHNWLAQVCSSGTSAAGPTIVLQDIVNATGQLDTPYLNAIVPYLPGYSNCFSKVYIGTEGVTYNGPGSLYQQGVASRSVAERYEIQSASLGQQFKADYPGVAINWYLTLESNLNYLAFPSVVTAYSSILTTEIRQLAAIAPSASFLWSPGFWYTYTGYSSNTYGMGLLAQGLTTLFRQLATATQQPVTVDLQDEVGTTNCWGAGAMTPQDAVDWAHFLMTIPAHPTIEMNTTLFQTSCTTGGTTAISAAQANATEQLYQSSGIKLGPAYEIRYWLQQHNLSLTTP
jgi:hypothetical protein